MSEPNERIVQVKVKPRASSNRVRETPDGTLEVWVTAPPVEGEANRAVIRLLADYFDVPPSNIEMISGETGRIKKFRVYSRRVR